MAVRRARAIVAQHQDLLLSAACLAIGVGAVAAAASGHADAVDIDVVRLGVFLAGPLAGAVVLDRHPGHLGGRLLALLGLLPVMALLAAAWEGGGLPDIATAAAAAPALTIPALALTVGLVAAFPDGGLDGLRRRVAWIAFGLGATGLAATAARAGAIGPGGPGGLLEPALITAERIVLALLLTCAALVVADQARRASRSRGTERHRGWWLILGILVVVPMGIALTAARTPPTAAAVTYAVAALQASGIVAFAALVLLPTPPPLSFAVGRALLLLLFTTALAVMYGVSLVLLGSTSLPDQSAAAAVLTALAALALLPLYSWTRLQLAVRLYGPGRRPDSALSLLRNSATAGDQAHDALRAACAAVAAAVRSPAARVLPETPEEPGEHAELVNLVAGGERLGVLVVEPRSAGEPFSKKDRELISALAGPVAHVAKAAALAAALNEARGDLAAQRLDERRRLRRDLHDGLGPLLASLGLQLAALRPPLQPALQSQAQAMQDTIARCRDEVRRLVEGLADVPRDEDLAEALTELVEGWGSATAPIGLRVDLEVEQPLPSVEGPVQGAVYRIAGEAITNAVRHAAASVCRVRLASAGGYLVLEVTDDGIGMQGPIGGFGLRSMGERAAAVNGTLEVGAGESGVGTSVRFRVPSSHGGTAS